MFENISTLIGGICFGVGIIAFYRQGEKRMVATRGCEIRMAGIETALTQISKSLYRVSLDKRGT